MNKSVGQTQSSLRGKRNAFSIDDISDENDLNINPAECKGQ